MHITMIHVSCNDKNFDFPNLKVSGDIEKLQVLSEINFVNAIAAVSLI